MLVEQIHAATIWPNLPPLASFSAKLMPIKAIAHRLPFWERRRPGGECMRKNFGAKHAGETSALPGQCQSNLRPFFRNEPVGFGLVLC